MSAAEPAPLSVGACALDAAELILRRGAAAPAALAPLPGLQEARWEAKRLSVCVQPGRWLVLAAPGAPGALAERCALECGTAALVLARGSGLRGLAVWGARHRALLARGCRLDLEGAELASGRAAATLMAQTPVTAIAVPHAMLLLAPASLAAHLHEWLLLSARALGPAR
ncbi:MAG: hypothetical protein JO005_11735, partial [Gammaproteobacteria bacterium]|nr:hypothetical protein [Gammaproteobacteria bacterium]